MLLTKGKSAVLASIMLVPSASAFAANSMPEAAEEAGFDEAANLNDAQISGVVNVGIEQAVKAAKSAQKGASNPKLVEYANAVIRDNERFAAEFNAVLTKASIKPEESTTSVSLRAVALRDASTLIMLKGAEFDRKFLHQHLASEQHLIDLLDSDLIPSAKNAEVKGYLQAMRGDMIKCVTAGKTLQTEVGE